MANFSTAALVDAQTKLDKAFQANELRYRYPAVHALFLKNTQVMMPDYLEARTREDRTVIANYFTRTSRALGSARSHNHTGAQGDSATLTPSWTIYTDGFVSYLKEADNKIYSFEELHMSKMNNAIANFMVGLESAASDALFAARTGVWTNTSEGTFDATDDVFKITDSTNGDRAIQISKINMDINGYQGMNFDIVCDSIAFAKFQYQAAQGISNSTNTSFQFQGITFVHDPDLTADAAGLVGAYAKGFWMVVPEGSIAALPWIPKQNRVGVDFGNIATYGQIMNPIDGLPYAVHTYEVGADGSSAGGQTQDVKIETQISIDMTYIDAPLSTATESSVFAFVLI